MPGVGCSFLENELHTETERLRDYPEKERHRDREKMMERHMRQTHPRQKQTDDRSSRIPEQIYRSLESLGLRLGGFPKKETERQTQS